MNTREKIIKESLKLFSKKGYDGVSMRDIASAVNIKASSIYSHFKSKEDIYSAIVKEMDNRYEKEAKKLNIDGINPKKDVNMYQDISLDLLLNLGKSLFLYFIHDEYTSSFRKMVTIGQYSNEDLAQNYTKQYFDDPITYQSTLFEMLIKQGNFINADSKIMAMHFFAPIYQLMVLCDTNPTREEEALSLLENHIIQFCRLYKCR